jgi:hypothetical protein
MMAFPKWGENKSKLFYGAPSSVRIMGIIMLVITAFVLRAAIAKF